MTAAAQPLDWPTAFVIVGGAVCITVVIVVGLILLAQQEAKR